MELKELDNIDAKWAKLVATNRTSERIEEQIKTCLLEIKKAAEDNRTYVAVGIDPDRLTIKELERRGFVCKIVYVGPTSDPREKDYLQIHWATI